MRIYLTHCSKEKSAVAKASGKPLPPDELYTEEGIRMFMQTCMHKGVNWAILSDKYGVFFPIEKHEYYEKPPPRSRQRKKGQSLSNSTNA